MGGKYRIGVTWWAASALAFAVAIVIGGCGKEKKLAPQSNEKVETPFREFGESTMYFYDGDVVQFILNTDYMRQGMSDTARMVFSPVDLDVYDSTGEKVSRILADSGRTSTGRDEFYVWGNVHVKRRDNLVIRSESLEWNRETQRVTSDDHVEIQHPSGDVLRGRGLDATETFSSFTFTKGASGEFPNFKERAESDEGF